MIWQFIINGFITGILYSLLAIGFALVYNTTKVFHLAAAGLYVVAAYAFYAFASLFGGSLPLAAIMATIITVGFSLLTDVLIYRPLCKRKSSASYSLIAAVGLLTILINLVALIFGNAPKVVESSLKTTYICVGIILSQPQIWQAIIGTLSIVVFIVFLHKSSWGKRFRAISDDDVLYMTLGYDVSVTRNIAFLLSGVFISLSSCLNVYEVGMDPNMGMNILINALAAMIIGGMGRFDACILGGVILGILQAVVLIKLPSAWQNGVTFFILIAFLLVRPQGIIGYKQRTI